MAVNAYLRLKSETMGDILGSVTEAGREDSIKVIAFDHEVNAILSEDTGRPSGIRQHQPIVITKDIDRATADLHYCWENYDNIVDWQLQFWHSAYDESPVQDFTIHLHNAFVVNIKQEMPNNQYPENRELNMREKVAFGYQKIEWVWVPGGFTAKADW